EPTNPNWRGPSSSSCMIGTAAIPITALSAKLITMNMKSSATTIQARLRSLARIGVALRQSGLRGCGLEHRSENTEPTFHEITSWVGGKLQEVGPYYHAEIRRGRRPRCP